ncbi:MAG: trigger factor [Chloroflexi bacterium]|nr:trigger factor [Chloroflexota bacterium]
MKVTREDLEQREVALSIEVEEGDLAPYYDKAYRHLVQRLNVPGFRKGKAPRSVVQRLVGDGVMLEEAMEFFVPEAVEKAIKEQGIEQGAAPRLEVDREKSPIVLKATVPLRPKVVVSAYSEIRLPLEPIEVTDQEVDRVLEDMRWAQAPWAPVDRPVALGDRVTIDARGQVEGKQVTRQEGVEFYAGEGNPSPVKGFAEALVGAQAGETQEFTLTVPDDFADAELAGKECTFQVMVHAIKAKLLPELDDEFAKGVEGGYESLAALKEKLWEGIRNRKSEDARIKYEESVVEELAGRATLEISPMLVEHEAQHILEEEEDTLKRQRVTVDQYLSLMGRSQDQHQEDARKEALDRITRVYALNNVAEMEGISATEAEVDQEIDRLVKGANDEKRMRRNLNEPDSRASVGSILARRRAIERLVAIAKGEETRSTAPASLSPATEITPEGSGNVGTA